MPDYATQAEWYAATFGDYTFALNGAFSGVVKLIPCDDGEIELRLMDTDDEDTIYLRPEEARLLAQELLRLAELV